MQEFEPLIIAFVCNWCTYAGADLAGTSRIEYPANVRIVRLMCTGSLDSMYIIKAFLEGADGVLVGGCHPGDCHYINGNYKAIRRIKIIGEIMDLAGISKKRLWLKWISASEANLFAKTIHEMVKELKHMGPNEIKGRLFI
jgi:coenzyme F420-reducing hydrogenase delta subunit